MMKQLRHFGRNGKHATPPPPPEGPCLTTDELIEFHKRLLAVQAAQDQFVMLDESYRAWLRGVGERYGVGTLFEVDTQTGRLTRKERPPVPPVEEASCPT